MASRITPSTDMSHSMEMHNLSSQGNKRWFWFIALLLLCFVSQTSTGLKADHVVFFKTFSTSVLSLVKVKRVFVSDQAYENDERDINRGFRQLPSRSAHRSLTRASTRRRGSSSVRRGSARTNQDVEIVDIDDLDDATEEDLVDPKELNQPMSAKRRYK